MIFNKKAGIRLQYVYKTLTDLGDFYAVGSQLCNKQLQTSLQSTVDGMVSSGTIHIKGNYQKLNFDGNTYDARATLNYKGLLSPYFDSSQGSTAGYRYVVTASNSAGSYNNYAIFKVLADGTTELFHNAGGSLTAAAIVEGRGFIFGESASNFYIVINPAGNDVNTGSYNGISIVKLDKATKTGLHLYGPTTGSTLVNSHYYQNIFEGIYNGLAVFSICSKHKLFDDNQTSTPQYGYHAVNLSSGTISAVTTSTPWAGAQGTSSTCHTVFLPHPADATKQCFYVCGSKGTGSVALTDPLYLYKFTVNSNIQAADTVSGTNFAQMTVVGAPSDFIYGLVNWSSYLVLETYGFTDNGTNYIAVVKHSKKIPATPYNHVNKLWLFKVETDGSTATFIQGITLNKEFTDTVPAFDGKTIFCVKANDGFIAYKFNAGSEQFAASEYYSRSGLRKFAVDDTDTVFVTYDDITSTSGFSMEIINVNNSGALVATFQGNPSTLQYTGTPIEVNVLISAYDMFGNRLARNINVYVEGCVFRDNGGGTAQAFTTDLLQDLTIPVIISTPGAVNITPEFA